MTNSNKNFPNSQDFSVLPDRKKFQSTLNNCNEEEMVACEYILEQKGRGVTVKEMSLVLRKSQSVTNSILRRLKEPEYFDERLETHLLVSMRGKRGSNYYVLREGVLLEDIKAIMAKKGYNRKTYQIALGLECPEDQQQVTEVDPKENAAKIVELELSSNDNNEIAETVNAQSNPSLNTNTSSDTESSKLTELITLVIKQQAQQSVQFAKLEQQVQALLLQDQSA